MEVSRIHEKNIRIRKIVSNLQLTEKLSDPKPSADEHPEWDLEVADDEVTVEKYVSEEERKRLDEEARLAEERRIAEMVRLVIWIHARKDSWIVKGIALTMERKITRKHGEKK